MSSAASNNDAETEVTEPLKRKRSTSSADENESESEEESDCECNAWDDDCKVLTSDSEPSSLIIHESKKIKLSPQLRSSLTQANFSDKFKDFWSASKAFKEHNVELITDPFKVCVVSDFLADRIVLDNLRGEFQEIEWITRRTDLYEFFQSKDLKHLKEFPTLQAIYDLLKTDVMKWVSDLTGYDLTHVSSTCSYYSNTDYLLVHDDQRSDRMVAFVLYLTDENGWDDSKGGALQLFGNNQCGEATEVVRNVFPANNQLVFFPVSNVSYHQVAEVTSMSSCRLSINGWFHTRTPPVFAIPKYISQHPEGLYGSRKIEPCDNDIDLDSWISEEYLSDNISTEIQAYFEENSEISLKEFLKEESFSAVTQVLESEDMTWKRIGPANRFNYDVLDSENLPEVLNRFLTLFQSKQMFGLLQKFTELELTSMKYELQRWTPGSYVMLTDYDWNAAKELDLILCFGCENNADVIGARTQYVTLEDQVQNALITIEPEQNNLNIIYRDTARFTQYYSKQSQCRRFYMLICSYAE